MDPAVAAQLADMRKWAADPTALLWSIRGRAIFPDEVMSKTDEQLLEFIRRRCNER